MVSPLQQYVSDDSDEEEVSIKASRRYVPGPRNASRNGNGNKGPVAGGAKGGIGGRASGLSRDLGSLSALSVSTLGSTGNESGLVQVSGGAGSGTGVHNAVIGQASRFKNQQKRPSFSQMSRPNLDNAQSKFNKIMGGKTLSSILHPSASGQLIDDLNNASQDMVVDNPE
ncbi:unnamed protein product [[Candida] boidinii]|nr:unnamed protein product [[Candida] boidinii]